MPFPRFFFSALTGPAMPGSVVPFDRPIEENIGFGGGLLDDGDESFLTASIPSSPVNNTANDMFNFFPESTSSSMSMALFGHGLDSGSLTLENDTGNFSDRK